LFAFSFLDNPSLNVYQAPTRDEEKYVVQVCGNVKVPLPQAQYQFSSQNSGLLHVGSGELSLNIAELDPVIYV
jgi:hypothetical protein